MKSGKLKILMTTDTIGGVWVYSYELCKELQNYDVEVHLAAMGAWPTEAQEEKMRELKNVILYKSEFKLEWMQDPWEDVENANKWLHSIYQTAKPDLIHFNNYAGVEKYDDTPMITVFHSCISTWWQAVKYTAIPEEYHTYSQIVQEALNTSDLVVAPTEAILEKAKHAHQITAETRVISNGISEINSEEKEKEPFILCSGRIWDEGKNLLSISKIAKDLSWPVYIAGNNKNPNTDEILEMENVHFLGSLKPEEVRDWMKRASIFVSPTKYEPFGLAALEAAMEGCALVISDIDTFQEIWEDSAIYFDPENSEEAKEAIIKLIENPELLHAFAEKAKDKSAFYNSKKMTAAYFGLYHELITRKKVEQKPVTV
ncbi:MAG TPA: glycosyltransferase family 4 protein [Salinimicrobium sp.]|nr:glycosyltransferase family 4 protein [Salinimicrobium sp.]